MKFKIMLTTLKQTFYPTYANLAETTQQANVRQIITKHAEGNTSLQLGKFVTEADINRQRQEVCEFKFSDK